MLELSQIKAELESKGYTDANSLFELRIFLMEMASFLTKQHISNFRNKRNADSCALLVKTFGNIRNYYHVLETTKSDHAKSFSNIKELVLTDISILLASHYTQDYKIIPLQTASLGIAK